MNEINDDNRIHSGNACYAVQKGIILSAIQKRQLFAQQL
jgi:hypothetical protein